MNVQFNPNIGGIHGAGQPLRPEKAGGVTGSFAEAVQKSVNSLNEQQQQANASITDLLTGKEQDVNTVVATMAKADMSFKMLVGVRNKLVEAYKETMRMPL